MSSTAWIIINLALLGLLLLWAKFSKLEFGLRSPSLRGIWPWLLIYILWAALNWVVIPALSLSADTEASDPLEQLPILELILIVVVTGPLWEEIFFRGALFAAGMRWGAWAAALPPSLLWGALHFEGGVLTVIYFSVAGMILAAMRWKSGSIYIPFLVHALDNLLIGLIFY